MRACRTRPPVAMATAGRWAAAAQLVVVVAAVAAAALSPPARGFFLPLQRPAECGDARYFDISRLACAPCGAHQRQSAGGERPGPAARGWGRGGAGRARGPCGGSGSSVLKCAPQQWEVPGVGSGFGGKTAAKWARIPQ